MCVVYFSENIMGWQKTGTWWILGQNTPIGTNFSVLSWNISNFDAKGMDFFYPTLTRIMDSFSCSPLYLFKKKLREACEYAMLQFHMMTLLDVLGKEDVCGVLSQGKISHILIWCARNSFLHICHLYQTSKRLTKVAAFCPSSFKRISMLDRMWYVTLSYDVASGGDIRHKIKLISHDKWFTYLVTLHNVIHWNGAYIMIKSEPITPNLRFQSNLNVIW